MSVHRFHFISGLPRSGSTLLSAILCQNPRFHAGISSPVGPMVRGLINQIGAGSEFSSAVSSTQRKRLVRGIFDSYYADYSDKEVIVDTNRMWCASLPLLKDQFPDAKIIACVRNVAWIMDSIERLYRANPYETTRLFNDDIERNTVQSRVDTLAQRNRLVGYAWSALKEAFYGEHADSMLLIDYELLARAPQRVIPLVYQFLGEPLFEHDYQSLTFDTPDFDSGLGLRGLHKVRARVEFQPRQTILPPDVFAEYSRMSFWQDLSGSSCHAITLNGPQAR